MKYLKNTQKSGLLSVFRQLRSPVAHGVRSRERLWEETGHTLGSADIQVSNGSATVMRSWQRSARTAAALAQCSQKSRDVKPITYGYPDP